MVASVRRALLILAIAALSLCVASANAAIVEETRRLTVRIEGAPSGVLEHEILLTIFRDSQRQRAPFLLLNHGRSGKAAERAAMGRARYSENSRYFVERGFVVIVPTRIGYGAVGGADLEDSGPCGNKRYPRAYHAAVQQSEQILAHLRTLPFVDSGRGVVAGQSFGGTTAIALAAANASGVVAAVNFAGGAGGRPDVMPGEPCGQVRIRELFASYGRTARIPTLWLYSENDRYWGPHYPAQWHQAFLAAGGQGRFVRLPPLEPPLGTDGHGIFTRNPGAWRPSVETFLRENGF
jgi:dienelactone hydrolase